MAWKKHLFWNRSSVSLLSLLLSKRVRNGEEWDNQTGTIYNSRQIRLPPWRDPAIPLSWHFALFWAWWLNSGWYDSNLWHGPITVSAGNIKGITWKISVLWARSCIARLLSGARTKPREGKSKKEGQPLWPCRYTYSPRKWYLEHGFPL